MTSDNSDGQNIDFFRDTPIRYLGYTNEVGESFRYQFPKFVQPSYVIAFGYCLADTYDKSSKQYQKDNNTLSKKLAIKSFDCLIWQTLASVMIPGWVIHSIEKHLQKLFFNNMSLFKYFPTLIGLCSIPFIIHPIDHFVDYFMDNTYRKLFNQKNEE